MAVDGGLEDQFFSLFDDVDVRAGDELLGDPGSGWKILSEDGKTGAAFGGGFQPGELKSAIKNCFGGLSINIMFVMSNTKYAAACLTTRIPLC